MSFIIPMKPIAHNSFSTTLDGDQFIFETIWNDREESWRLSILSGSGVRIVSGLKLITSRTINLEYRYNQTPKGYLICIINSDGRPTFDDLGSSVILTYFTAEEVDGLTI